MCDSNTEATTSPETEENREQEGRDTHRERRSDHWLDGPRVLDAELPEELQVALGRFVGRESVDTLGAWATEVRRLTGGGSIAVEDLCHTDGETEHWGTVGDERYYFRCFYDAVILAAFEGRPVDVHTVSPAGAVVEARAVGSDDLSVTPTDAVFSMGIELDAHERSGGDPTRQDGYAALCPYVKAFPDRESYGRWADDVPAATVALPLSGATDVANALVA